MRLTLALVLFAAPLVAQTTYTVPDPGLAIVTIGNAVALADPGDTIVVKKGVYPESVVVLEDDITFVGKSAIVDGHGSLVPFDVAANGVSISGFTVRAGSNPFAGIDVVGSGAIISKNKVEACAGRGIRVQGDDATITGNTVFACGDTGIAYSSDTLSSATLLQKNKVSFCDSGGIVAIGGMLTIDGNTCSNNDDVGVQLDISLNTPLTPPVVTKNKVDGNDIGIEILDVAVGVLVEKNTVTGSNGPGLVVDGGSGAIVRGNKCTGNLEDGIELTADDSEVSGNTCSSNGRNGIVASEDDSAGGSNDVLDNKLKANGRDGIRIEDADNLVQGNSCQKNWGDGIDVDEDEPGNTLDDNSCSKNLHEGIDNNGLLTVITDNSCKGNGTLDIAGAGQGDGTLSGTLDTNTFVTGGAADVQLADVD